MTLLVLGCFAAYWGWLGWDSGYQTDPVSGRQTGPYEPWQVVGCVLTLLVLAVVAGLAGRARTALTVMPLAFTTAWGIPASADDESGLWGVGALLLLIGMLMGTSLVAFTSEALARRSRTTAGSAGRR